MKTPLRDGASADVPDAAGIFGDGPVARKLSRTSDVPDGHARPSVLVGVQRAEALMGFVVRRQVGEMHVEIAIEHDLAERLENTGLIATEVVREDEVESSPSFGLVVVVPPRA